MNCKLITGRTILSYSKMSITTGEVSYSFPSPSVCEFDFICKKKKTQGKETWTPGLRNKLFIYIYLTLEFRFLYLLSNIQKKLQKSYKTVGLLKLLCKKILILC